MDRNRFVTRCITATEAAIKASLGSRKIIQNIEEAARIFQSLKFSLDGGDLYAISMTSPGSITMVWSAEGCREGVILLSAKQAPGDHAADYLEVFAHECADRLQEMSKEWMSQATKV